MDLGRAGSNSDPISTTLHHAQVTVGVWYSVTWWELRMLMCALPDLLASLKPTVDGQWEGLYFQGNSNGWCSDFEKVYMMTIIMVFSWDSRRFVMKSRSMWGQVHRAMGSCRNLLGGKGLSFLHCVQSVQHEQFCTFTPFVLFYFFHFHLLPPLDFFHRTHTFFRLKTASGRISYWICLEYYE